MRTTVIAATCVLLITPQRSPGQDSRNPGILFAWGTINVALAPDAAEGLRLLSATTPSAGPAVGQRGFEANFVPDSARAWAAQADSLLAHPPDTGWVTSRPVTDRWGSGMVLVLRRQKARGHLDEYLLFFRPHGTDPFRIQLTPSAAVDFIRGVQEQAALAGWSPAPPRKMDSTVTVVTSDAVPVQRKPEFLRGPMLQYPELLREEGVTGAVWAQFRVDSAGHPDPTTLRVLFSNNPAFSDEVRRWAKYAVFQPAVLYGHPVPVMVEMPFTFTLR